jgi:hypothetical protein
MLVKQAERKIEGTRKMITIRARSKEPNWTGLRVKCGAGALPQQRGRGGDVRDGSGGTHPAFWRSSFWETTLAILQHRQLGYAKWDRREVKWGEKRKKKGGRWEGTVP